MGAGAPGSALAELQLEIDELYADAGRGVAVDLAVVLLDIEPLAIDVPSTSSSSWPRIKAMFSLVKAATGAAMSLFLTSLPFLANFNLGRHVCGRSLVPGHGRTTRAISGEA